MIRVQYTEGKDRISINSKTVGLSSPIWEVYEHEGCVLVVLDPDTSIRNVLCFNSEAELVWTIEFPEYYSYREPPGYESVGRGGLDWNGRLLAYIRGRPFELDIDTGKVTLTPGSFEK